MSLSRKRRKELNKLRSSAEELWGHQQEVLDKANRVAREASRQVGHLTREEVAPRVRDGYHQYVEPRVSATRDFAKGAGDNIERTVLPAIGNVLGAVLSIGDIANDARVRSALKRTGMKKYVDTKPSGPGAGTYIAVTLGVLAAAGVAYAVWQTFRADDELWIADEPVSGADSSPND
jgi:hypothetical protein